MDRMIGILGGMGPKASQLFYDMVTEMTDADKDQDHVRMMIYSDPSIPDRTQAILRGEYDQVYEKMLKNALTLEAAGCEAIGITCNTAHFFAEMIADKLNIPIIHMIAHTVFHIKRRNPGAKIAILATEGTIKTQLYQRQMEQGEMCIRDRGEAVKMKKFIQRIVDLETGGMKEKDITLTVNCEEDQIGRAHV